MDWHTMLTRKGMTMYRLSERSGVPKTTVLDICSGRSTFEKCSGQTIQRLASALNCTMEDVMTLTPKTSIDKATGKPTDQSYLACGLPTYLQKSLDAMKKSWAIEDSGAQDDHWDWHWSELNADINSAQADGLISSEQAWYLRENDLRMKQGDEA